MAQKTKTTSRHPSYPNPTIAEALCEIHFTLPAEHPWKPSLAGDLFKRIQNDFPEFEPGVEIGLKFEVGPQGFGQTMLPPRQRSRFKHASRPLILQLARNVFTVNVLPKYAGWETMRTDVLEAWEKAKAVLKPESIKRIGLRYINRIERDNAEETPGEWLVPGNYIPPGVLRAQGSFLSRVEVHRDPENRLVVTLTDAKGEEPDRPSAIILDIDRVVERSLAIKKQVLAAEMDRLHEDIWEVFKSSQSETLIRRLEAQS